MNVRTLAHYGACEGCTPFAGFMGLGATASEIKSLQEAMNTLSTLLKTDRYRSTPNGSLAGNNGWFTFIALIHLFRDFSSRTGPHKIDLGVVKDKISSIPGLKTILSILTKEKIDLGLTTVKVDTVLQTLYFGGSAASIVTQLGTYLGVDIDIRVDAFPEKMRELVHGVAGIAGGATLKTITAITTGALSVSGIIGVTQPPLLTPPPAGTSTADPFAHLRRDSITMVGGSGAPTGLITTPQMVAFYIKEQRKKGTAESEIRRAWVSLCSAREAECPQKYEAGLALAGPPGLSPVIMIGGVAAVAALLLLR